MDKSSGPLLLGDDNGNDGLDGELCKLCELSVGEHWHDDGIETAVDDVDIIGKSPTGWLFFVGECCKSADGGGPPLGIVVGLGRPKQILNH